MSPDDYMSLKFDRAFGISYSLYAKRSITRRNHMIVNEVNTVFGAQLVDGFTRKSGW